MAPFAEETDVEPAAPTSGGASTMDRSEARRLLAELLNDL